MKKQDLGSKDAPDFFLEKDMWLISKNSAITEKKDNFIKRNWQGFERSVYSVMKMKRAVG